MLEVIWNKTFLGLPAGLCIRFGIILLIALLLYRYFASVLMKVIFTLFKRVANPEHLLKFKELLHKPVRGVLLTVLLFVAVNQFDVFMEKIILFKRQKGDGTLFSLLELADHVFFFCFIFNLSLLLARTITFLFYIWLDKAKTAGDRERQQLLPLLRDVVVVLLWSFGILTILGVVFHVNVPTLIAGLGFGGVAVAFAAKESLENLLASFMIMVDKPFAMGDHIRIGGVEGNVEKIGFRSTRIRTFDQTLVSMPNKNLIGDSLENFTARPKWRIRLQLGAIYGMSQTALQTAISEIRKFIDDNEHTTDGTRVFLEDFGASAITIHTSYFIALPNKIPIDEIRQQINLGIYKIMYRYVDGFAFNTQVEISGENINQVDVS